jgi:hypothetical protein
MGREEGLLETHEPCVDGKRKEASPVDELEVLSTTAAMEDDTVSDGGDLYSTGSKRARCDGAYDARTSLAKWSVTLFAFSAAPASRTHHPPRVRLGTKVT